MNKNYAIMACKNTLLPSMHGSLTSRSLDKPSSLGCLKPS